MIAIIPQLRTIRWLVVDKDQAHPFQYDVCLSFAGEDRIYVAAVAKELRRLKIDVFYDDFDQGRLWGKDLFEHLDYIYRKAARHCVVFISAAYARKEWTNHERKSAQARALEGTGDYILPAKFDDTEIPGFLATQGYLDLRKASPERCALFIAGKFIPDRLSRLARRSNFMPDDVDILMSHLKARNRNIKKVVEVASRNFFHTMGLMDISERLVVGAILCRSCPHEFPNNAHIDSDLLERITKVSAQEIRKCLRKIKCLGFKADYVKNKTEKGIEKSSTIYLEWHLWTEEFERNPVARKHGSNLTYIAIGITQTIGKNYCYEHTIQALLNVNFSALSSETVVPDLHLR